MELLHRDLTEKIIGIFYKVYNELGYGFLEKVYHNAMCLELSKNNLQFEKEKMINVFYDNEVVGEYYADLLIENKVIVEIKAAELLKEEFEYQLVNYLKATKIQIGLILNFGKKAEIKRKIFNKESV
jgi:GxxExxY protein